MKKIVLVMVFVCMSFIISCNTPIGKNVMDVDKWLQELQNYKTEADVTFTLNQKNSTMKVSQAYTMNGKYQLTILEPENLKGYVTVWDGDKMEEYNPVTDKKVQAKPNPVKNQVLFGTFVHNYLHVENDKRTISEEEEAVVVEIPIPGSYKYMAKEKVWFNKKSQVPTKMVIYDREGKVTIEIVFQGFQYNDR